ncbi:hypothetical protein [Parasphingorhabdus sp.]
MNKYEEAKVFEAIKDAVESAISIFGIAGVRALSMFPSAQKAEKDEDIAA